MVTADVEYLVEKNEPWLCSLCTRDVRTLRSNSGGSAAKKHNTSSITADQFSQMMSTLNAVAADVAVIKSKQDSLLADTAKINSILELHSRTLQEHANLIEDCRGRLNVVSTANTATIQDLDRVKTELAEVQANRSSGAHPAMKTVKEDIAGEITERLRRASSLILRGLPDDPNPNGGPVSDRQAVQQIVEVIDPSLVPAICSVSRLGDPAKSKNGIRPVKVRFSCNSAPLHILRNKVKLRSSPFKDISIQDDKTPEQQNHLAQLRAELKRRHDDGDLDCTIKYVKGSPTIISTKPKN